MKLCIFLILTLLIISVALVITIFNNKIGNFMPFSLFLGTCKIRQKIGALVLKCFCFVYLRRVQRSPGGGWNI